MRIAVIGGGAAGMTVAYLLDAAHDVTVFEKEPVLGGSIRTLNGNVRAAKLDRHIVLDNGVIEFPEGRCPRFVALLDHLGVKRSLIRGGSSTMYLEDGTCYRGPHVIKTSRQPFGDRLRGYARLATLAGAYLAKHQRIRASRHASFRDRPVSDFLGNDLLSRWHKMLLMYAYSTPYPEIAHFPASMGLPTLSELGIGTRWFSIPGGVYAYIDRILSRFGGTVHTSAVVEGVTRTAEGVRIHLPNSPSLRFDKVVFATTPEQFLELITDPTADERRRFGSWQTYCATTLVHTDTRPYLPYGTEDYMEFDVFEKKGGTDAGYNAYLNRLAGISYEAHYYLAYNLADRIDPTKVIDIRKHIAPKYTVEAIRYRHEVQATNGLHHTYHAGAYLGNGLHEGAITSAVAIAQDLGGRVV